jgi:hypothetical protein
MMKQMGLFASSRWLMDSIRFQIFYTGSLQCDKFAHITTIIDTTIIDARWFFEKACVIRRKIISG